MLERTKNFAIFSISWAVSIDKNNICIITRVSSPFSPFFKKKLCAFHILQSLNERTLFPCRQPVGLQKLLKLISIPTFIVFLRLFSHFLSFVFSKDFMFTFD